MTSGVACRGVVRVGFDVDAHKARGWRQFKAVQGLVTGVVKDRQSSGGERHAGDRERHARRRRPHLVSPAFVQHHQACAPIDREDYSVGAPDTHASRSSGAKANELVAGRQGFFSPAGPVHMMPRLVTNDPLCLGRLPEGP